MSSFNTNPHTPNIRPPLYKGQNPPPPPPPPRTYVLLPHLYEASNLHSNPNWLNPTHVWTLPIRIPTHIHQPSSTGGSQSGSNPTRIEPGSRWACLCFSNAAIELLNNEGNWIKIISPPSLYGYLMYVQNHLLNSHHTKHVSTCSILLYSCHEFKVVSKIITMLSFVVSLGTIGWNGFFLEVK